MQSGWSIRVTKLQAKKISPKRKFDIAGGVPPFSWIADFILGISTKNVIGEKKAQTIGIHLSSFLSFKYCQFLYIQKMAYVPKNKVFNTTSFLTPTEKNTGSFASAA